ncbi:hypothetical protein ACLB2K_077539 [Fragaria x ananassa]
MRAACDTVSLSYGLAVVVRNEQGILVAGSSKLVFAPSAIAAEAKAIDLGLCLASSLSLSSFSLESDSLSLSHFGFSKSFVACDWSWTSRKANSVADFVASLSLQRVCSVDWITKPPTSLMLILLFDAASPPP